MTTIGTARTPTGGDALGRERVERYGACALRHREWLTILVGPTADAGLDECESVQQGLVAVSVETEARERAAVARGHTRGRTRRFLLENSMNSGVRRYIRAIVARARIAFRGGPREH